MNATTRPGRAHGAIRSRMEITEAVELIGGAVPEGSGTWADLGAGSGTFTRALASLLGPGGRVLAVDQDERSLAVLRGRAEGGAGAGVVAIRGDFRHLDAIRDLDGIALDGALFANSLHFAPDAERVLAQAGRALRPGGRVVVVEYEGRPPSRWVPYPLSFARLRELAPGAGLHPPERTGDRPSAYGGVMYCAVLTRPE